MVCSNCGTENRPGRKFCLRCGAALAVSCPVCGTANEPESLFCGECGTPLSATSTPGRAPAPATGSAPVPAASRPAVAAERRLVSVLFADLVGFTPLSERRDAEEVRDLLTRYFDTCRELVARYGGAVEKFIGDAVMAAWGTPVAHEDDAERSVRAALDLVEAVYALGASLDEPGLSARAAVLTGDAAVTVGAEGQGMVAGDLVNTASRLQSIAEPGTVLVGESTYLAARSAVAFEEAGEHALKGKEAPVKTWRALRVVAGRRGAKWTDVLEPPFVGRDDEFRLLKDLFHATAREGRARLVSVMGIGGIGKSRLAWELFKYLDGTAGVVYWHQGRSPAYGEGLTFWALAEMVRMRAHIAETESPELTRQKLAAAVQEFATDDEEQRWILGALAHLLGLEEGAPSWEREELFAAWRTFFERIADRDPVVMVFEDLHWADPGLLDFVEHLLESSSRTRPLLIVTLARPELLERRPTWGAGQRSFTSIHLEPLAADDMTLLIKGLAPDLPPSLVERILERAEGVPLYAVETVRMLVDRGALVAEEGSFRPAAAVEELDIPDSLHALIAARLDALGPADRALVQDGAVLGKSFTLNALSALTGERPGALEPRLLSLIRKELLALDADPRSPERGQYGFVQGLIREVAYQTLSKKDRRNKHLAAAEHFEGLADDELASIVATHYLEAYRAAPAGPESEGIAARARDALVAAAERAGGLGSHGQAVSYLEQALEVTAERADAASLHEQAGEAALRAALFDQGKDHFERAIALYRGEGDHAAAARATVGLGSVHLETSHPDLAIELLEPAAAQFSDPERDPAWIRLAAELARAYMFQGAGMEAAQEWAERVLVAAERQDLGAVVAEALSTKGAVLDFLGRHREAQAILRGALDLAREEGQIRAQLRTHYNLAFRLFGWAPRQGVEVALEGLALARKLGLRRWEVSLASAACIGRHDLGDWDGMEALLAEFLTEDLPQSLRVDIGLPALLLHAERGSFDEARSIYAELEPIAESSTRPDDIAITHAVRGLTLVAEGDLEESHRLLLEALDVGPEWITTWAPAAARPVLWLRDLDRARAVLDRIEGVGARGPSQRTGLAEVRAGVATLEGRIEEAHALYEEAARGWRDLGAEFLLAMTRLDSMLLLGTGERTREATDEARAIFTRLRARPYLERLETAVSAARPA